MWQASKLTTRYLTDSLSNELSVAFPLNKGYWPLSKCLTFSTGKSPDRDRRDPAHHILSLAADSSWQQLH